MLRVLAAWIITLCFWPPILLVHLLSGKHLPERWITSAIRFWGRSLLKVLGVGLEVTNLSGERDPLKGRAGRVVIVNHQSALDVVWTAAMAAAAPFAIGKKEVIYIPVINLAWWALDFVRVDRKNHEKALAALAGVARRISAEKRSLYVAVEGTRTYDGSIGPFKRGAFYLARDARVPIYPLVVSGAFELLPRNRFLPQKGQIQVAILPAVSVERISRARSSDEMTTLIEEVRDQMATALAQLKRPSAT